ncbi:MAG TPA: MMPL family transporter, partial [bacterium]|nr:MMPL family transporter [bacterium]
YNTTRDAQTALAQQAPAILTLGLTMAGVFFTLAFSPLDILRDIGLGLGLTALVATALTLTFAPATLSFFTFKEPRRFAFLSAQHGFAAKLAQGMAQRRKALTIAAVAVTIAATALTFFVPRNANMMDNFPAGSEPRVTDDLMLAHFGGSSLFMINFRGKDVREPAILEQMELLSKRIRTIENVYFPQSIADVVTMLNRNLNAEPTVPESMEKINNLWFMLEGQAQVAMLLDKNYTDGIILGRIGSMDAAVVGRAIAQLRQAIDETVDIDLVSVAPGDFPEVPRKALLKALAERAAEKAALDYQFHTGKKIQNPKGFARALREVRTDRILLTAEERADLQSRIAEYLSGSGCDVVLPENFDATPAAQALAALDAPDAATLVSALQQALPPASWQEDPESLNYAAATIGETFDKLYKRVRLAKARKTAEKAMALDLRTAMHAALSADLNGDLWTINNNRMGVAYARFKQITGAEPPAENRIAVEVRLTGLPVVTAKLNDRLPADTAKVLGPALALIFVIALVRTRRAKTAGAVAWAAALAVLINFAALTVLGIALDNIIVVVQNIAMAVGAAYALLLAGGTDEGRAIVAHTSAVALGFAAMIFAALGTQALLGLFITLSMITTTVAAFALVPGTKMN